MELPTTTDAPMKHLPVPPLPQTLQRTREALAPLATNDELQRVEEAMVRFAADEGPRCQAELEAFAAAEAAAGRSWLSEGWFEDYLAVREPLPLTTSVAFQVAWDAPGTPAAGIVRAADIVHRLATVHLRHLAGELEPETGHGGARISADQRRYLAGGIREPRVDGDSITPGSPSPANREIGVIWRGNLLALPISDADGAPLGRAAIGRAFAEVVARPAHGGVSPLTPSYLGSGQLAPILEEILLDDANRHAYARLADLVFVVTLIGEAADVAAHLTRANVGLDQAWAYKPTTYQIGLADDVVGFHMEHSTFDAGTTIPVLVAAKAVEPVDGDESDTSIPSIEPLDWRLGDELATRIAAGAEAYAARASSYRVRLVTVPKGAAPTAKVSADALLQLIMLAAQLRVHGRVRSTYEAVDMREYQAGRTECLRPNTRAAVSFARSLLDGVADADGLRAALAAQRALVKAAKSGQVIDRHLWGLQRAAARLGLDPELLRDPAITALTTNWLSTSSLGAPDPVRRIAFPTVVEDGLGIYYVTTSDADEFLLNWRDDRYADIDAFEAALVECAELVHDLARRL